jgi:hypothetical protein
VVDRYLILSSWLSSQLNLLELGEAIASFLVAQTDWRTPYTEDKGAQVPELYYLKSTWSPDGSPPWGKPLDYRQGGNEKAREQISQREVGKIKIGFPTKWRNPYVLNKAVYQPLGPGVDIFVEQINQPDFFVKIVFYYSAMWFSPPSIAEVIYDSYHFVREYRDKFGYELNKGDTYHYFDGQEYVAKKELSQENRQKVIIGLARYMREFLVKAAVLTYQLPAKLNPTNNTISFSKEMEYVSPMYYLGQDASLSTKSAKAFDASYFVGEVEGLELHLEEEHFSFLKAG